MDQEQILEIQRSLGRIEGALEPFVERTDERLKDHSSRIRGLEKWRWYAVGAVAAVLTLTGFALRFIQ